MIFNAIEDWGRLNLAGVDVSEAGRARLETGVMVVVSGRQPAAAPTNPARLVSPEGNSVINPLWIFASRRQRIGAAKSNTC